MIDNEDDGAIDSRLTRIDSDLLIDSPVVSGRDGGRKAKLDEPKRGRCLVCLVVVSFISFRRLRVLICVLDRTMTPGAQPLNRPRPATFSGAVDRRSCVVSRQDDNLSPIPPSGPPPNRLFILPFPPLLLVPALPSRLITARPHCPVPSSAIDCGPEFNNRGPYRRLNRFDSTLLDRV